MQVPEHTQAVKQLSGVEAMLDTIRSVASLLVSYGLLLVASSMFSTLLSVRSRAEDFSTEIIGLMTAGYFLGLMLGARYSPAVIAPIGHIRAFAAFASFVSVMALLHVLWVDPYGWIAMRILGGFAMAGLFTVTESWLNASATNANRGRVLSFYMITNYAAAGLGQLLIPFGDPLEFHLFSIASIVFSVALLPVLLTRSIAPTPEVTDRSSFKELLSISPLGLFATFCGGLMTAPFHGVGPVYAQEIGLDLAATSRFMAITIFGGLLFQFPVGWLSDRYGRRVVIGVMSLLAAAASALIVYGSEHSQFLFYAASAMWGSTAFTLYSLSAAHTNDQAPPGSAMQVAAALIVTYGIGAIAGPIVVANLMTFSGPNSLFWFATGSALLLSMVAFWRRFTMPALTFKRRRYIPTATAASPQRLYSSLREQRERDRKKVKDNLTGL